MYIPDESLPLEEQVARANEYSNKTIYLSVDPEDQDPEYRRLIFSYGPLFSRFVKPLEIISMHELLERKKNRPPDYRPPPRHPLTLMPRHQAFRLLCNQLREAKKREEEEEEEEEEDEEEDNHNVEKEEEDDDDDNENKAGHHCSKKLKLEESSSGQVEQPPLSEAEQCVTTCVAPEEQVVDADDTTSSDCILPDM